MSAREDGAPVASPAPLVLFASHLSTLRGGAELCLYELAVALRDDGRVRPIVTVPLESELSEALSRSEIPWLAVPTPLWTPWGRAQFESRFPGGGAVLRARRAGAILRHSRPYLELLRRVRPSAVVTSTVTTPVPALTSALLRIPHVWWVHEFATTDQQRQFVLGEGFSKRAVGVLSAEVVVNSNAVARHYAARVAPSKIRVVYPGITVPPVAPNPARPGRLRMLLLGHQQPAKGTELAVRALGALRDAPFDPQLRLVGSITDDYRRHLLDLAHELDVSERLTIVDFEEPTPHLEWCNVLIMGSVEEAFGRVTAEALASGRPVVGARSGGTVEIVHDGVDGLLFTPDDHVDLARRLHELGSHPARLLQMSAAALESSATRFTMAAEVDAFSSVLDTAIGSRRRYA